MKKLAEEATIENVLESIKENKFNRTQDIIDFIMVLEHTYFPVYYNAWLYDNHSDPLMSLILSITKVCECYCDDKF